MTKPHGIVFCGPPGKFAVWTLAPNGLLIDREYVELLGQLAVRSGASDYRIFELDSTQEAEAIGRSRALHGQPTYLSLEKMGEVERLLLASQGVPT